jgi:hypothetical protein
MVVTGEAWSKAFHFYADHLSCYHMTSSLFTMTNSAATNGFDPVITQGTKGTPAYTVDEKPIGTPRPIRVIAIGAGASGLNFARQIELHMPNVDLTIYEKNADVGGTWFENRYPGCACDIPAHNYQFTWEPNPNWSAL